MSWEYTKYEAICNDCKHSGIEEIGSNDWGQNDKQYAGFRMTAGNSYEIMRNRIPAAIPICECGSTNISRGKLLGYS